MSEKAVLPAHAPADETVDVSSLWTIEDQARSLRVILDEKDFIAPWIRFTAAIRRAGELQICFGCGVVTVQFGMKVPIHGLLSGLQAQMISELRRIRKLTST